MLKTDIPERASILWNKQGNSGFVLIKGETVMLNESAIAVWVLIDGVTSVQKIIEKMKATYGADNSEERIEQVVEQALDCFLSKAMIAIKSDEVLGGWK